MAPGRRLELVSNVASVSFEIDIAPSLDLAGQQSQEMVGVVSVDLRVVVVVEVGHQVPVMILVSHMTRVGEIWLSPTMVEGEED